MYSKIAIVLNKFINSTRLVYAAAIGFLHEAYKIEVCATTKYADGAYEKALVPGQQPSVCYFMAHPFFSS